MKRRNFEIENMFGEVNKTPVSTTPELENANFVPNPILETIYAFDPDKGYESGDIAIMMSDKVSPDIKMYIQNNLYKRLPESTPMPEGDFDTRFIRGVDESPIEYAKRINVLITELNAQ